MEWPGHSLVHRVMRKWVMRRKPLVHVYSLVGHLCSPNKTIMADAAIAMSLNMAEYESAVENLVKKLLLDPNLVGSARLERLAWLMDEFWKDLNHFQSHTGLYDRDYIWVSASKEDCEAHRWHQHYSLD